MSLFSQIQPVQRVHVNNSLVRVAHPQIGNGNMLICVLDISRDTKFSVLDEGGGMVESPVTAYTIILVCDLHLEKPYKMYLCSYVSLGH